MLDNFRVVLYKYNAALCLGFIGMESVRNELFYKEGQFYKDIIGKSPISYNSFVKFHGKKNGGHNMTV